MKISRWGTPRARMAVKKLGGLKFLFALGILLMGLDTSWAVTYYLRAGTTTLTMPDGQEVVMWGFSQETAFGQQVNPIQVPGPELVVPPGDTTLRVIVKNTLPKPISLVIPGQYNQTVLANNVEQSGNASFVDEAGRTRATSFVPETPSNNSEPYEYRWDNMTPGTYLYHSGSHPAVQVQMGLYGAVKAQPSAGANQVYPGVAFDKELTLFYSEIDPDLHGAVASDNFGPGLPMSSTIDSKPRYFLINGKPAAEFILPVVTAGLGKTTLLRFVNACMDTRVPTFDGNEVKQIAEDGKLYPYPRTSSALVLPALKTIDALWVPTQLGQFSLYERRGGAFTVSASTIVEGSFLSMLTPGGINNSVSGWLGCKITVGAEPLTVTSLGRWCLSGNSRTHALRILDANSLAIVASTAVSLAGATPGQFIYSVLPSPVQLAANTSYYLVSQETSGGDTWYDRLTLVSPKSVAQFNGPAYTLNGTSWTTLSWPNRSYIPVDFLYSRTTVIISGNVLDSNGAALSGVTLSGLPGNPVSGANGAYSSVVPLNWSGTVTPTKAGYTFTPVSRNYSAAVSDLSDQNYTGTSVIPIFSYVKGVTPGNPLNTVSGWLGCKFTVGSSPITVTSLGRWCLSGNSGTHTVRLVDATTLATVASVPVSMAGAPPGEFKYATLASPVVLAANTSYYLASQETNGGDNWYDRLTAITTQANAVLNGPAYNISGTWQLVTWPNRSYIPLSFQYQGAP